MNFTDPTLLARTYRDPIAQAGLIIDLIPIYAVLALGWGAAPLVLLYWLENLVIGAVTLARLLAAGAGKGVLGFGGALFLGAFFTFHYGMFCFVHGQFLAAFAGLEGEGLLPPPNLIAAAMGAAPAMPAFVSLIAAWQAFVFVYDYLGRGEFLGADPNREMMGPYGRVIVLHIGIFAGAAAMAALGEPMIGVLSLILLRAVWGVFLATLRRRRLDRTVAAT